MNYPLPRGVELTLGGQPLAHAVPAVASCAGPIGSRSALRQGGCCLGKELSLPSYCSGPRSSRKQLGGYGLSGSYRPSSPGAVLIPASHIPLAGVVMPSTRRGAEPLPAPGVKSDGFTPVCLPGVEAEESLRG